MSYKYEDPKENGYRQVYITRKQHNKTFKYRQLKWYQRAEYYLSNDDTKCAILHTYTNIIGIVSTIIYFPLCVLINGFGEIKEILKDYKKLFNQRKKRIVHE